MDRNSFLSCLPFLIPSVSSEWPPRTTTSSDNTTAAAAAAAAGLPKDRADTTTNFQRVFLANHHVSIEPLSSNNNNDNNLGPAFFESSRVDSSPDPALSKCEVDFQLLLQQPQTTTTTSTSLDPTTTPRVTNQQRRLSTSSSTSTVSPSKERGCTLVSLCLCINDRVYYVDWRQLERPLQVQEQDQESKPCCLLLYFPSCLFRIFALNATTTKTKADYDLLADQMNQVLVWQSSGGTFLPALATDDTSSASSPTSSALLASSDGGYGQEHHETSSSNKQQPLPNQDASLCHKRKRQALETCHSQINALAAVLELPAESSIRKNNSNNIIQTDIFSLLTSAAEELASAYYQHHHSAEVTHHHHNDAVEHQASSTNNKNNSNDVDLEQLLTDFFPAPRSRKPRPPPADILERVQQVVQKQKQAMQERHELCCLLQR